MAVTVRVGLLQRLLVVGLAGIATIRWLLLVIHLSAIKSLLDFRVLYQESKGTSKHTGTAVAGDMTAAAGGIPGRPSRVDNKTSQKFLESTQGIKRSTKVEEWRTKFDGEDGEGEIQGKTDRKYGRRQAKPSRVRQAKLTANVQKGKIESNRLGDSVNKKE